MLQTLLRRAAPTALALTTILLGGAAPAATTATVTIGNFTFGPAALVVQPGTTVTWVNADDTPHKVVATDNRAFRSPVMDTDQRFSFTFSQPGTYAYFCSLHPHMTGKIVVKAP